MSLYTNIIFKRHTDNLKEDMHLLRYNQEILKFILIAKIEQLDPGSKDHRGDSFFGISQSCESDGYYDIYSVVGWGECF